MPKALYTDVPVPDLVRRANLAHAWNDLRAAVAAMRQVVERFQGDRLPVTDHEPVISIPELLQLTDRHIS